MLPSRSVERRAAAQKGEQVPRFETASRVDELERRALTCGPAETENAIRQLVFFAREQEKEVEETRLAWIKERDYWRKRAEEAERLGLKAVEERDRERAGKLLAEHERNEARAENLRLEAWVNDCQSGMYINCVYCGHRYGPKEDTPVSMRDVLKQHIEKCPKHPLTEARAEVAKLRSEIEALRRFKAGVDEALNSGDGVYRP